jgi:hypothetical protein
VFPERLEQQSLFYEYFKEVRDLRHRESVHDLGDRNLRRLLYEVHNFLCYRFTNNGIVEGYNHAEWNNVQRFHASDLSQYSLVNTKYFEDEIDADVFQLPDIVPMPVLEVGAVVDSPPATTQGAVQPVDGDEYKSLSDSSDEDDEDEKS